MVPALASAGLTAIAVAGVSSRTRQLILLVVLTAGQLYASRDARRFVREVPRLEMNIDRDGWWTTAGEFAQPFREAAYDPVGAGSGGQAVSGRWSVPERSGTIVPRRIADDAVRLGTSSTNPMTLVINSPYFPGWHTTIDGNHTAVTSNERAFMVVSIPPGQHEVATLFGNTPVRHLANAVSAIATVTWLLLVVGAWVRWWLTRRTLHHRQGGG
jgi:hypothetical protein